MGWVIFILVILFFVGCAYGGLLIRRRLIQKHIDGELMYLGDYVYNKCVRHGINENEANSLADQYTEDFLNHIDRIMLPGNYFAAKGAISNLRLDLQSEIDARFR